ncbi:hypothetical protein GCM10010412_073940 [Nonomuraea recticatena]|uniref:Uncharacterized protein n=1 Tax=Nonomuraea recticatena TaxID=46178 RepID=A0ABP6F8G5_9ACTN
MLKLKDHHSPKADAGVELVDLACAVAATVPNNRGRGWTTSRPREVRPAPDGTSGLVYDLEVS